jgi:toxin secretion/phage lysis holin
MIITKLFLLLAAFGALGSGIVAVLWGGWSQPMTVLCILMGLDYLSGVAVALVFHKSPKTETGGASSLIGLKGLLRKVFLMIVVAAGYQLDTVIGGNYIRDGVAIAFICNEALSLIENAGLMGIPIPKVLLRGIDVLKGKTADKPPDPDGEQSTDPSTPLRFAQDDRREEDL